MSVLGTHEVREVFDTLNVALTLPRFGLLRSLASEVERGNRAGVVSHFEVSAPDAGVLLDVATQALLAAFPDSDVQVREV